MRKSQGNVESVSQLMMQSILPAAVAAGIALGVGGCADSATKENLNTGYASLENQQYGDALTRADTQLVKSNSPSAPGSAEALYLKGRAIEQRVKKSPADAQADLIAAKQAYVETLNASPAKDVEANARASLANICYWQDDYTSALQEWQNAYGKLKDEDANNFILYRIGICQQRLAQFDAADQTFAKVMQAKSSGELADRAKAHMGARSFSLQLATYANAITADAAVVKLRGEQQRPIKATNARGQQVVTVGPFSTYAAALQVRNRLATQYPDAVIVP